jgi:hypothetical protein
MQDTSKFDEVLKDYYEGGIRELIPLKVKTYNMFEERDAKPFGGRHVRFPSKVGRNQGVGAYAEGGALPTAGRQQYATATIPMRYLGGRIKLTKQVMEFSESNKGAFSSAMDQEMRGLVNDLTAEMGRIIFGDGRGILAVVNGDPSTGTTITVDAPGGFSGATNGARFINPGMLVTFVTPGTGQIVASADETVTAVPAAGTTFTIGSAAAAAIADNDYIVRAHKASLTDVSDTSYAKEPMGLAGLVDDGTYVSTLHGLNRTTYPIVQSTVISSVGALSADVLQRGIDLADQRGGGTVEKLIMHHSVRRAYIAMTDNGRRYTGGDLSRPDAGTVAAKGQSLTFGGISIMEDKYAPYGTVFGVDTSTFSRYVSIPGAWMDEDGSILQRVGSGSTAEDAFEAFYRLWLNFHVEEPATCFRLDGVTATVAVSHVD